MESSRRQMLVIVTALLVFLAALIASLGIDVQSEVGAAASGEESLFGSNLGFFFLINVNIIVVLLLVFLVTKNIVKLVLDRRRRILGSHLRSRLVAAFVALSLVPTVLLFFVSKGIVGAVMQGWFSPQVTSIVDGSLEIARNQFEYLERNARDRTRLLLPYVSVTRAPEETLTRNAPQSPEGMAHFAHETLLREKLAEFELDEVLLATTRGELVARVTRSGLEDLETPVLKVPAFRGDKLAVQPEKSPSGELFRAYVPLRAVTSSPAAPEELIVVTTTKVPRKLSQLLTGVLEAFDDYKQLRSFRQPIASSYLITLAIVTLMVIFAAIWVGFYLSRTLTEPIRMLASGTSEIARGNLGFRLPEKGDDEFGILVRSFNKMTEDLQRTTDQLVAQRRSMEIVLKSVNVGVLSVDTNGHIVTLNPAAARMLQLKDTSRATGARTGDVLPKPLAEKFEEIRGELAFQGDRVSIGTVSLHVHGRTRHFQLAASVLSDERGGNFGTVLLIDDLTELVGAQRMAAWREVAKRIAHEIKNPLTPIQLSAQRIRRRLLTEGCSESSESSDQFIIECTETIVNQVEALRSLVDEFSKFARLPNVQRSEGDLNAVLRETVGIFSAAHADVQFSADMDPKLPRFEFDREQIGRILLNLLDNAVAAVKSTASRRTEPGKISIVSLYDPAHRSVLLSVSDNGPGIPDQDKPKVIEPYYSTKRGGTGLGLAIVGSIAADHGGFLRVQDSELGGARLEIELPLESRELRKQA